MIDNSQVTINDSEVSKNVKIQPKDIVCINIIVESIESEWKVMNACKWDTSSLQRRSTTDKWGRKTMNSP